MWAVDFYLERLGGSGPSDLAIVIAWAITASVVVGLCRVLAEARRHPTVLLPLIGGGGFWWAAWSGHPWVGMIAVMGGTIAMPLWQNWRDSKAKPGNIVPCRKALRTMKLLTHSRHSGQHHPVDATPEGDNLMPSPAKTSPNASCTSLRARHIADAVVGLPIVAAVAWLFLSYLGAV